MAQPRILLLLSQLPQDPASGAARSMRTIVEFLAADGMEVETLATTSTEAASAFDSGRFSPTEFLPEDIVQSKSTGGGKVFDFTSALVRYRLLDTCPQSPQNWMPSHRAQFEWLFGECLERFRPNLVFTYGGSEFERARIERAHAAGCKIVFGLRNLGYLVPRALENVDAVLTGSRFVSERYRDVLGVESTPLPLPLAPAEVLASQRERIFIVYINPSTEKGVFFAARLFEELSNHRPDLPILVVESRASSGLLVSAGLVSSAFGPGFDLRRHANIMVTPTVRRPADIFALARVVIVPSVWEEPAGRVAAEALLNGIPPIVSNRGGLPEVCAGGGFVLSLPSELIAHPNSPVSSEAVQPWIDLLVRLADDESFYDLACCKALKAGRTYAPESLIPRYARYFRAVLAK